MPTVLSWLPEQSSDHDRPEPSLWSELFAGLTLFCGMPVPPRPLWSSLQDLNVKSDLDRELLEARRTEDHRSHLSLAKRIFLSQHRRGRIGVVEHPWGSRAWGTTAFRKLPGGKAKVDQCQYGAVLPDENGDPKPIRKRTRLQATPEGLAEKFTRVCPGGHQHLHLMGGSPGCPSRSKAAGAYQPGFCNGMADKMIEVFARMSWLSLYLGLVCFEKHRADTRKN